MQLVFSCLRDGDSETGDDLDAGGRYDVGGGGTGVQTATKLKRWGKLWHFPDRKLVFLFLNLINLRSLKCEYGCIIKRTIVQQVMIAGFQRSFILSRFITGFYPPHPFLALKALKTVHVILFSCVNQLVSGTSVEEEWFNSQPFCKAYNNKKCQLSLFNY